MLVRLEAHRGLGLAAHPAARPGLRPQGAAEVMALPALRAPTTPLPALSSLEEVVGGGRGVASAAAPASGSRGGTRGGSGRKTGRQRWDMLRSKSLAMLRREAQEPGGTQRGAMDLSRLVSQLKKGHSAGAAKQFKAIKRKKAAAGHVGARDGAVGVVGAQGGDPAVSGVAHAAGGGKLLLREALLFV